MTDSTDRRPPSPTNTAASGAGVPAAEEPLAGVAFHAVIPAGGSGTRLWPLSRGASPKFLHDILGTGRTLLQATWDRVEPLAGAAHTWVVTGRSHTDAVTTQLPGLAPANLVAEPGPKDSAAAIGLAAMLIADRDPEAVIGSFSADHSITNVEEFRHVIQQAVVAASTTGDIVTVGITPRYPATAYGYIRTGGRLGIRCAPTARRAEEFVEKPEAERARSYVYSGRYRWNAGMFIARVSALLDFLAAEAPDLFAGLRRIADVWDAGEGARTAVMDEVWPALEKRAIDYVVAEPAAAAGRVVVVPGDFGWDDVGDFDSVANLRQPVRGERTGVFTIGDGVEVVDVDASGVVIAGFDERPARARDKVVALVGLDDVVVVETDDVLLVAARSHAQDVKRAVEAAERLGRTDVL